MKNDKEFSREYVEAMEGPAVVISKEEYEKMKENNNAEQNRERLAEQKRYFRNINDETRSAKRNNTTSKDKLKRCINNLSRVEGIKIEDCRVYDEYSVIVLYDNGSDIIVCDSSEEVNAIYNYLTKKFNEFKAQKNEETEQEA